jgi:hypothetical protein
MRRFAALTLGALLALNLVATTAAAPPPRLLALPVIGIQTIGVDGSFLDAQEGEGRTVISAFVETGSLDSRCLATLSETNIAGMIKELYCAPRQVVGPDGRTQNGLFLHIFLNGEAPEDVGIVLNYYQERMVTNPQPIPCTTTEAGFC